MRKQDRKHIVSARYKAEVAKVDKAAVYEPLAALELVKATSSTKFDSTIDVAINLGVDPRQGDQMVRGTTDLPHGTGKSQKVAVFAKGANAEAATAAGADEVGAEELITKIQNGWRDFDVLVATPDMMPAVGKLGRLLAARMPNPKSGTVTTDVAKVVTAIKKATRVAYRVDKGGIIHAPIGKASFPAEQLQENLSVLVGTLIKAKPSSSKGRYIQKITVSSSMGPGVSVDVAVAQRGADK
ncbi:50S ribosomal protein L1 [Armatimonas rosea]|uniref:Large ribosomal subunit protein uL1 n=1 Tax=Armatimonas rosea TaxID=685828 RepID=A0A7W9SMJ5_ARMRO|nr:50S ribosomal protein L1 [Armatimonas rosea]MBB6048698.1 large subunit ribosomal protein L1 [Armatimonas rosea]